MHVYFTTIFPDACDYEFDYFIIRSYSKLFNHNTCVTVSISKNMIIQEKEIYWKRY